MKFFESYSEFEKKPAVFIIHAEYPIGDTISFNFVTEAEIIEVSAKDEDKMVEIFKKNEAKIKGIILSGGVNSKREHSDKKQPGEKIKILDFPKEIVESGKPILAICYGYQWWMSRMAGASLARLPFRQKDMSTLATLEDVPLLKGLEREIPVVVNQRWCVAELPEGYQKIAETSISEYAGAQNPDKKFWGLQFHPEKNWTRGIIFANFVKMISKS
jgi:GMP synthase-like glutamine amidotransferase